MFSIYPPKSVPTIEVFELPVKKSNHIAKLYWNIWITMNDSPRHISFTTVSTQPTQEKRSNPNFSSLLQELRFKVTVSTCNKPLTHSYIHSYTMCPLLIYTFITRNDRFRSVIRYSDPFAHWTKTSGQNFLFSRQIGSEQIKQHTHTVFIQKQKLQSFAFYSISSMICFQVNWFKHNIYWSRESLYIHIYDGFFFTRMFLHLIFNDTPFNFNTNFSSPESRLLTLKNDRFLFRKK